MPEAVATAPESKIPPIPSKNILRNDIQGPFISNSIGRGKKEGLQYLSLDVNKDNLHTVILPWVGDNEVISILQARINQLAQGWWAYAVKQATPTNDKGETTGPVDQVKLMEVFESLAANFSARGDSIPKLKDRIEEQVDAMASLEEVPESLAENDPQEFIKRTLEFRKKFNEYTTEIKKLQAIIESKRRDRESEEDSEEVAA